MRPFSFVHAADLHIDSPFRGVTADSGTGAVSEALYSSTFRAFDALIETTLEREADFLLIAGDVYDGQDRSLRAQLRLRDGLVRLDGAGIESFIVHGNHDPLDSRVSALDWPEGAHFFGRKLESLPIRGPDGEPVASVSGISFQGRSTRGVTVFRTADGEKVVSVTRLRDVENGDGETDEIGETSEEDAG